MTSTARHFLNPNIDSILNPYLPRNQLRHLPRPVSHFLGYRAKPAKEPPILLQWLLTVFATVAGMCVVGAVYNYAPGITRWNPPTLVASLGASAVLDYNTIRSPLAQPRNAVIGHAIAAIVGTGVAKAFMLVPNFFTNYDWVAAAVACAAASLAMSMTNTVHPPGGATAIIACLDRQVIDLGWMYPALMLLASVLMLGVACLFNNLLRQYPVFWWTPEDVGYRLPRSRKTDEEVEKGADIDHLENRDADTSSSSDETLARELSDEVEFTEGQDEMSIWPYKVRLPSHVKLSDHEVEFLQKLQQRLREHAEVN